MLQIELSHGLGIAAIAGPVQPPKVPYSGSFSLLLCASRLLIRYQEQGVINA
jgi:hypothetical protein